MSRAFVSERAPSGCTPYSTAAAAKAIIRAYAVPDGSEVYTVVPLRDGRYAIRISDRDGTALGWL